MEGLIDLVNILPALAIAAIFIWYEKGRQAQMGAEHREERQERETERQQRDEQWRAFLTEQRNATLATLDVFSLRLQQLGDVIVGIDDRTRRIETLFGAHDQRAEAIALSLEGLRAEMPERRRPKEKPGA